MDVLGVWLVLLMNPNLELQMMENQWNRMILESLMILVVVRMVGHLMHQILMEILMVLQFPKQMKNQLAQRHRLLGIWMEEEVL